MSVEFMIPVLARTALSSNADGTKRNRWTVSAAKEELGEASTIAALAEYGPTLPHLEGLVDVFIEYRICYKRRPQDGYLRFRDPSNGGGDVAKTVIDYGLVKTKIITDDDYRYVRVFACAITPVDTLSEEGIVVRATEVQDVVG